MRHGPALAGLERQTRLGAIERLDLGFLVIDSTTAWAGGCI
jgi:hypothetical protein